MGKLQAWRIFDFPAGFDILAVNTDCDHSPQGNPDSDLSVAGPIPGENDLAPVFIGLDSTDGNGTATQVSLLPLEYRTTEPATRGRNTTPTPFYSMN